MKRYPVNQSSFYRLRSKRRLAQILKIDLASLKRLAHSERLYTEKEVIGKNGKPRLTERPSHELKQVQARISELLSRIEIPSFLFCPARGRSYIINASSHVNSAVVKKLDIKEYFQRTASKRVYWFFHTYMECAEDIAGILTRILTYKGHLPTGSPSSPILSYYGHVDMWERVDTLAREAGCTLTVYMDDVTLSGVKVPDSLVWKIKQQIHRCGLQYHKEKFYAGKVREVTGVIMRDRQLKLPNRQHEERYKLRQQLASGVESEQQNTLLNRLQGYEAQANQIEKENKALGISSPTV